jgi:hypothetical protein
LENIIASKFFDLFFRDAAGDKRMNPVFQKPFENPLNNSGLPVIAAFADGPRRARNNKKKDSLIAHIRAFSRAHLLE